MDCLSFADRTRPGDAFQLSRIDAATDILPGLHRHDYDELFWIEYGACTHLFQGHGAEMAAGDLVFLRKDQVHRLCPLPRKDLVFFNICVRDGHFAELLRRHHDVFSRLFAPPHEAAVVHSLGEANFPVLRDLARELAIMPNTRFSLEWFLFQVVELLRPRTVAGLRPGAPDWLQSALLHLTDREIIRRGATAFVARAGRSHEHVSRITREFTGRTPHQLITRARMEQAKRELRLSSRPVAEIADDCGYSQPSHFHNVFKREVGITPKAFRLQHRRAV